MNDCMMKHERGCSARVCMVFCHDGYNYNVNVMCMSAGSLDRSVTLDKIDYDKSGERK